MAASPDHYETLQVSPAADPEVIEAAYRTLVEKWQAERRPGDPAAFDRLAALDTAYMILSDPAKREEYDQHREKPGNTTSPSATLPSNAEGSSSSLQRRKARLQALKALLDFAHARRRELEAQEAAGLQPRAKRGSSRRPSAAADATDVNARSNEDAFRASRPSLPSAPVDSQGERVVPSDPRDYSGKTSAEGFADESEQPGQQVGEGRSGSRDRRTATQHNRTIAEGETKRGPRVGRRVVGEGEKLSQLGSATTEVANPRIGRSLVDGTRVGPAMPFTVGTHVKGRLDVGPCGFGSEVLFVRTPAIAEISSKTLKAALNHRIEDVVNCGITRLLQPRQSADEIRRSVESQWPPIDGPLHNFEFHFQSEELVTDNLGDNLADVQTRLPFGYLDIQLATDASSGFLNV